ncbi:MAG: alpha/beta hydrolase [Vallitaleaceae bacterium]|nr:alpha/beta hydrolase [Vallitaleaceae bacterium]
MYKEVFHLLEGVSNATLTAYVQDTSLDPLVQRLRPAMIICPGGGYVGIAEKEAEPVAMRFLSAGYQVFILKYSIGFGIGRLPAPFVDAANSVKLVRENAVRWGIDADKIGICGFSTGGHVAAVLATSWQEAYLSEALNSENESFKPNALVLCYPILELEQFNEKNKVKVPEMGPLLETMFGSLFGTVNPSKIQLDAWNCSKHVSKWMTPTFIWTTSEDAVIHIEETTHFIKALASHQILYEFHVFAKGGHGLSLSDQTVGYSDSVIKKQINAHKWMDLALTWLEQSM